MPSIPGISTSSSATSGRCSSTAASTSSPRADLGHHLEVGLEAEQGGERAAHQGLVVGEQEPDRRSVMPGHGQHRRAKPRGSTGARDDRAAPTARGPLAQPGRARGRDDRPAVRRRCRRRRPRPRSRPAARCTGVAPLCRITLVTPSRTVQANSSRSSEGTSSVEFGQVGLDLGGRQRRRGPGPARRAGSARGSPRRPGVRRPGRRGRAARGRRARRAPARGRRRAAGWPARP